MKDIQFQILQSIKFFGVIDPSFISLTIQKDIDKVNLSIYNLVASNSIKISHKRNGKVYYKLI